MSGIFAQFLEQSFLTLPASFVNMFHASQAESKIEP